MKMKKKLFCLLAISILLSSCNKAVFDVSYKFDKIHLISAKKCIEISSWQDYEDGEQIQVKIKDTGTVMLISSIEGVLINGTCPYCSK